MRPPLSKKLEDKVDAELERVVGTLSVPMAMVMFEVVRWAACYWHGVSDDDFCIQSVGETTIVFGGTNRLVWSPSAGYRPDRSYCTQSFLHRWEQLGRLPALFDPLGA